MRRSLFFLGASFGLALLLPLGDALTQAAPGGRGGGGGGGMRMGGGGGGGIRSGGSSFGGGARMGGGSSIARSGGNFGGGSPRMSSGFGSLSGIGGGARSAAPSIRSTPSLGGRSVPNLGSNFSARPSTNLGSNFSARPSTNLGSLGGRSLGSAIQPGNRLGSQLGNSLGNNPLRGSTTLSNGQITRGGLGNLGQNNSALNNLGRNNSVLNNSGLNSLGRNVLGQNNSGLNSALRPNSGLNQALNNTLGNRGLNNPLNGNRLGSNTLNNGLNNLNGLNGGRNGLSQATQALAGANRNGLRNVNVNNINNVNRVSNVNNVVNNVLNNRGNSANLNNGNWKGWNGNWNNNNWGRNGNWNNGHWHGNGNWNGQHHHHNHGWYNNYSWYRGHRHNPWGYYGGFGGWGWWGVGLGWGNGWGYNNWGYNNWGLGYPNYGYGGFGLTSLLYRSGYCSYYNPYYVATPVVVYDYAQPIPVPVSDATPAPVPAALSDLDLARQEFLANDYADALAAVNRAIQAQPGDPVLHEFRALTLFAMGDYDQAASTLYSVLAVGPGWDWATMIGLYPNVATYTAELRNLETYARNNPNSASARFVLAYHYMTAVHQKEAAITLKEVLVLKPNDQGSANLLKMLEPQAAPNANPGPAVAAVGNPADNANPAQPNFAAPLPQLDVLPAGQPNKVVNAKPIEGPALVGSWQAARDKDKFNLTLGADQTFTWKYAAGERVETLTGTYNVEGSLLVMQVKDGGQMIGRVTLVNDPGGNPAGFEFKMLGGNPDDPGLRFSK